MKVAYFDDKGHLIVDVTKLTEEEIMEFNYLMELKGDDTISASKAFVARVTARVEKYKEYLPKKEDEQGTTSEG